MPNKLFSEEVNIFQCPNPPPPQENEEIQITIGDLHGNAIKLMFMLIKHGIATNISAEDYAKLVEIYTTKIRELTSTHLTEFNEILSKIEFTKNSLVRLIGDELADRGNNDYFTLKILEKLHKHQVPVEIIVSNHSIEFIEACEKQKNFNPPLLKGEHAKSLVNLQALVEGRIIKRDEILNIANTSYKPTLRAISYSLSQDKNEITIYSHAPIGLKTIKDLANKVKIKYQDKTVNELASTIDLINSAFQDRLKRNKVMQLYDKNAMNNCYKGNPINSNKNPFEFIIWNRYYDALNRPTNYHNYNVNFVHGHDPEGETKNNVYNLDNQLGKKENTGLYTVLLSLECQLAPIIQDLENRACSLSLFQSAASATVGVITITALGFGVATAALTYLVPAVSAMVLPTVAAVAALVGISATITPLIGAIAVGLAVGAALLIGATLLVLAGLAVAAGINMLSQRLSQDCEEHVAQGHVNNRIN